MGKTILERYQVRKTKGQKTAFIEFMQSRYPELKVETGGLLGNRNLILGDVDKAELVVGAHYDTCAQLPFPNFLPPKNVPLYITYSLLICLPFFAIGMLCSWLTSRIEVLNGLQLFAFEVGFFVSMFAVFFGKANKTTVNDNTSGVLTLLQLYEALSEEDRQRVAFVFFDNEENGLLGSMRFAKVHKAAMKNKLLLNFDCVSDGDHLLLVMQKGVYPMADKLRAAFLPCEGKEVLVEKASNTMYPSDQANFPMGVGVAALKKKKGIGLYLDRIHTKKDTVLMQENLDCLVEGTLRYLEQNR